MTRLFLFIAALMLALPAVAHAQPKNKAPNIIYIMSDDHANAAIGAYNSWLKPVLKTPNLDKLAKQGMLFKMSMVTNSICTPSRAAILTGQYSNKNGVYTLADPLSKGTIHVGHLLQMLGYQTALIGKSHLTIGPTGCACLNILRGQRQYINPPRRAMRAKAKHCTEYKDRYSEDLITDISLDWLKKRDKDKPF